MKNITKTCLALLALMSVAGHAQNKPARQFGHQQFAPCGTTEYENNLLQRDPSRGNTRQFEQWLAPKVAATKARRLMRRGVNEVVTIPVVVHIIHDGDAIGQGENISDAQVMSQITVLNQDFRKMQGTPGHNINPVGADTEIEFCLAQRDPQGVYSTGIMRYPLGSSIMGESQIEVIKAFTQWDPEKYLNIWVVASIIGDGGMPLLGYAQFPEASGLPGLDLEGMITAAGTDGIVMACQAFGSSDLYPQGIYFPGKDKGHTLTHETGHYFGVRHIWGDGFGCDGNDFCSDTPAAAEANAGCPPQGWDTCPQNPGFDMFENYMDYTDDACQNIFTLDQKDRMQAVLENSPRRASLLTSDGCIPGMVFGNEGSLDFMEMNIQCNTDFMPQLTLKNTGNNPITSAAIAYSVDEGALQVFNWSGNVAAGQQVAITLPQLTVTAPGQHFLHVKLQSVNGQQDVVPGNDDKQQKFTIAQTYNTASIKIKVQADAFDGETFWRLRNSNGQVVASSMTIQFLSGQEVATTVNVANGECYAFEITDVMGDGICCNFGLGYYRVETAEDALIAQGGEFGTIETTRFKIDTTMAIGSFGELDNIKLYPNPANGVINVSIPTNTDIPEAYIIYNNLGQKMATGKMQVHEQAIDVSAFAKGIYFVKLETAEGSATLRFIKE